jgi:hypothetical protein
MHLPQHWLCIRDLTQESFAAFSFVCLTVITVVDTLPGGSSGCRIAFAAKPDNKIRQTASE